MNSSLYDYRESLKKPARSISDLVDDSGVGLSIASAHLGGVSHTGCVAFSVADLLASNIVAAAALVAPHEAEVTEAIL